jgi:hypothetical protein
MSQFAILIVTDESTVRQACRGWDEPLAEPVILKMANPFNPFSQELMEVKSYIPEHVENNPDRATLHEAHVALRKAQPVVIDFQVVSSLRPLFSDGSVPLLIGREEDFPVTVDRVLEDREAEVVENFRDQLGEYADGDRRRAEGLSMFVLVYDP